MKNEVHSLNIVISDEDDCMYSINIIKDSNIIWSILIKDLNGPNYIMKHPEKSLNSCPQVIRTDNRKVPKNSYLEFIINNYEKDITQNLLELYGLLCKTPESFVWNADEKVWDFQYSIASPSLINCNWKESIDNIEHKSADNSIDTDTKTKTNPNPSKEAIQKYNKIEVMGKGAYSTVYLSKNSDTNIKYIIKQVKKVKKGSTNQEKIEDELQNIAREIQILKRLAKDVKTQKTNSYFPIYVDDMEDEEFIYIITEHIGNYINLDSYMKKYRPTNDDIRHIFYNLLQGLELLHKHGVIHKDIKPKNIIINPNKLAIQYIDFGLSCWSSEIQCINRGRGTPLYIAPEIYYRLYVDTQHKPYNSCIVKKSDIWALGLVFSTILGSHPFEHIKTQEELTDKMISIYRNPEGFKWYKNHKTTIEPLFHKVIDAMVHPRPSERDSLRNIIKEFTSEETNKK